MSSIDAEQVARIRWRCRRGLLELDLILNKTMDERYQHFDSKERDAFHRLLDLADVDILKYVHDPESCPQKDLRHVLKEILTISPAESI